MIHVFITPAGLSCLVMLCLHVMATVVSYVIMVAVTVASVGELLLYDYKRASCIEKAFL